MAAARRILLLGGHGFIGRAVQRQLSKDPGAVVVTAPRHRDCNIRDAAQMRRHCAGANVVVNLVGILDERAAGDFDAVHRAGADNVARAVIAAAAPNALLVHLSAIGADASSPLAYARSKGLGEQAVRDRFAAERGGMLRCVILRPSIVFGPRDDFMNRFARLTRYLPVFPVFGSGRSRFQPVHVDNLAAVIANACTGLAEEGRRGVPHTLTLQVGGPDVYTFKELLWRTTRKSGAALFSSWLPPYFIHVPVWLAEWQAALLEFLVPVGSVLRITRAQVKQLQLDNVVAASAVGGGGVQCIAGAGDMAGTEVQHGASIADVLSRGVKWTALDSVFRAGRWL